MQVMADVLNIPIKVAKSEQGCAIGAAIFGTVAAGLYQDVPTAMNAMASPFEQVFQPIKENVVQYEKLYADYSALGKLMENYIMQQL